MLWHKGAKILIIYFKLGSLKLDAKYIESFSASDDDLSSEDSGRTLDGKMHKNSVCAKESYTISFMPLSWTMTAKIMKAVRNKNKISFTYPSPLNANQLTTNYFYIQARSAAVMVTTEDGKVKWQDLSFTLTEI